MFTPMYCAAQHAAIVSHPHSAGGSRRLRRGTLLDRITGCLPARETTFHFHYRIALSEKLQRGLRGQVAGLRVAIHHVGLVAAEARSLMPLAIGQVDRAGKVSLAIETLTSALRDGSPASLALSVS
jgi:hypothetical protein